MTELVATLRRLCAVRDPRSALSFVTDGVIGCAPP
jgi:hypothetical protein